MSEDNSAQNNQTNPQSAEPDADELRMQVEGDEFDLSALGEPIKEDEGKKTEASQIEYLQKELADAKDQMMRALADAENTRKRFLKERQDAGKYAIAAFSRDLIEVADNLRRALDAAPQELINAEPQIKSLFDGVEATERALLKTFEKNQIKSVNPLGEIFNPNYHEVMFEVPDPSKQPGIIIQVLETGYILNDRLLRPARVGVVKDDGQGHGLSEAPSREPGGNLDQEV